MDGGFCRINAAAVLSFSAVAAGMYLCRSESPARKIAPGLSNACNNLRVSIGETPGVMVSESQ